MTVSNPKANELYLFEPIHSTEEKLFYQHISPPPPSMDSPPPKKEKINKNNSSHFTKQLILQAEGVKKEVALLPGFPGAATDIASPPIDLIRCSLPKHCSPLAEDCPGHTRMQREVPQWGQLHTFALHFGPFGVLGSSVEVGRKMWARFRFPNLGSQCDDFARTSFLPLRLPERWDFLNLEAAISHQRTVSSSSRLPQWGIYCEAHLALKCMHGACSDFFFFYLDLGAASRSCPRILVLQV